jgi:UDP-N-acetylglucosamine 1-carboxyvinyltransferase
MDMFVIRGGRPLQGRLPISGSKNAALPVMAAALAVDGPVALTNVPQLADVDTLGLLLQQLGVAQQRTADGRYLLQVTDERECVASYELVRQMRAGICVLGPLLAKRGRACVSLPGGCNIGHRPIDLHLKGLAALGADIRIEKGYVFATAGRLHGAEINLTGPAGSTVTGTCNIMTAACLARGDTTISGAACEPEVIDLGHFLIACGARISGLGTSLLKISGVTALSGRNHSIIPDRIEAATWMIAAAMTRGELQLTGVDATHLQRVIETVRSIGLIVEPRGADLVCAAADGQRPSIVLAEPYPGIPTDVQAQLTALLSLIPGTSRVIDRVCPSCAA